jgi:cephalosporin hydroxylase
MSLTLNELALYYRSDKGKLNHKKMKGHNYIKVYEHFLCKYQLFPFTMLEIGVRWGDSMNIWQDYFSNAFFYGIDIDPECEKFKNARVNIFTCDQSNKEGMKKICEEIGKNRLSVIIDDGSHKASDIIASLEVMKDYLCNGGLYFIEDMDPNQDKQLVKDYVATLKDMRLLAYVPSEAMNGEELGILQKI